MVSFNYQKVYFNFKVLKITQWSFNLDAISSNHYSRFSLFDFKPKLVDKFQVACRETFHVTEWWNWLDKLFLALCPKHLCQRHQVSIFIFKFTIDFCCCFLLLLILLLLPQLLPLNWLWSPNPWSDHNLLNQMHIKSEIPIDWA